MSSSRQGTSAPQGSSRWALTGAIAFGVGVYYLWKFFEKWNPSSNDFPISEVGSVMSKLDLPSPLLSEGHRMTYPPDVVSDTTCSAAGTYIRGAREARAKALKSMSGGGLDASFSGLDIAGHMAQSMNAYTSSNRAPAVPPILVIYGSESGTAKGSALGLARELRLRGSTEVEVLDPSTINYTDKFPGWHSFGRPTSSAHPSSGSMTPLGPTSPSRRVDQHIASLPTSGPSPRAEGGGDWDEMIGGPFGDDDGGEAKSFDDVYPLTQVSQRLPMHSLPPNNRSVGPSIPATSSMNVLATSGANQTGTPLETFCDGAFNKRAVIVFVVATYGDGGPCANFKAMHEALTTAATAADHNPAASSLFCETNVAVFAYGSGAYKKVCQSGKATIDNLMRLGANILAPLACADSHSTAKRPMDDLFDDWQEALVGAMEALDDRYRAENREQHNTGRAGVAGLARPTLFVSRSADGEQQQRVLQMVPTAAAKLRLDDDPEQNIYPIPSTVSAPTAKRPLKCKALVKRRLVSELQHKVAAAASADASHRTSVRGSDHMFARDSTEPSTGTSDRNISFGALTEGGTSASSVAAASIAPIVSAPPSGELLYMSFDISANKAMEYQAGDHLSIYARNDPRIAASVLELVLFRHLQLPLGDQENLVAAWFAGAGSKSNASTANGAKQVTNDSIAIGEPAAASSSLFRNKNIKNPRHYFGTREGRKEMGQKAVSLEAPTLNKARASGVGTLPCKVSLQHAFEWYLDLSGPPKRSMLRTMARCCRDPSERVAFMEALAPSITSATAHPPLKRIYDYLQQFPSCVVPLDLFLECCPRIQPRRYSIASDSLRHPNEVHIIAKVVPNGLATRYLDREVVPHAESKGFLDSPLASITQLPSASQQHHDVASASQHLPNGPSSIKVTPPQSFYGTKPTTISGGGAGGAFSLLLSPHSAAALAPHHPPSEGDAYQHDYVYAFISPSNFHLPPAKALKTKSILMIGPGTGIAPLLGFTHRRLAIGLNGGKDKIPSAKREGYSLEVVAAEVAASVARHARSRKEGHDVERQADAAPCLLYVGCRDFNTDCAVRALFDSDPLMVQQLGLGRQGDNVLDLNIPKVAIAPLSLPVRVAVSRGPIPVVDPMAGLVLPSLRAGKGILLVDTIPHIWDFGKCTAVEMSASDSHLNTSINIADRSPGIHPQTAAPTPAGLSAEDITALTAALRSRSSPGFDQAQFAQISASPLIGGARSHSQSSAVRPIVLDRLPLMVPPPTPAPNKNNYVQSLIHQEASMILSSYLHNPDAYIYICGDALRMAKDVRATFISLLTGGAGKGSAAIDECLMSAEEAETHLATMERQGRYLQDIW